MISVVGLSHKSAPIEVREQFALPAERVPELLTTLVARPEVGEALLVSTCNRVELVAAARSGAPLDAVARASREALSALAPGAPNGALYALTGGGAVKHLFNVASSLDSLVLGEPQILGQVKDAYEVARRAGTVGAVLHRTLSRALHTAKLVRSHTTIGSGQVSVPSVAAELARRIFGDLSGHRVLLVGSGEMAETVARLLQSSGARLLVVGRTPEKVAALAQAVGGEGRAWADLASALGEVDIVITSTSAPGHVIELEHVKQAQKKRRGRSQFYIDLAVPRDVSPKVQGRDGVFLYNIDDLSQVVADTLETRSRQALQAQEIIDAEVKSFDRWADAEQATPIIVALRERIRAALGAELSRSMKGRLRHLGAAEREALETMLDASVNRLLHGPTTRLREAATLQDLDTPSLPELSAAIEHVFALDEEPEPALSEPRAAEPSVPPRGDAPELAPSPDVAKLGAR